jgi:hypothetical protein
MTGRSIKLEIIDLNGIAPALAEYMTANTSKVPTKMVGKIIRLGSNGALSAQFNTHPQEIAIVLISPIA